MGMTEKNSLSSSLFFCIALWSAAAAAFLPIAASDISDAQAAALLEFYSKIEGPKEVLGNWDAGSATPCNWAGVQCDPSGSVTALNLNGSGLRGTISGAIGNITTLVELDLSNNYFSGSIPDSIAGLKFLANFSAGSNNLSDRIPDLLGSSGSLVHVDLSFNLLNGSIPSAVCESSGLRVLTLTNNSLSGGISANISQCQSLQRLFLGTNSLSGDIPTAIGELESLVSLDLSKNSFVGQIPSTFSQSTLTYMSMARNKLEGNIPEGLGGLVSLKGLLLNENRLTGTIPTSLANLTDLEILDLSENDLTGSMPTELGRLSMLTSLKLHGNWLSGEIPSSLKNCSSLLDLELSQNNFSGSIPPEMGRMPLLTYGLNVSWNNLVGSIPDELGELQNLIVLDLSHNKLTGRVPYSLETLRSLLVINLAYNSLNGSLPNFRPNVANASDFEGNPGLCGAPLNACPGSGDSSGNHSIHVWLPVIAGIGVALVLIILGLLAICYLRLRYGYAQTDAEPRSPLVEGRLFIDDEKPLTFTFDELVEATQMISMASPVGKGRYSTVYRIVMPSGQEIAIKKLKVDAENSSLTRKFTSELQKIDKMQHRNLLTLLGYVLQGDSLLLVYEFCPNGSLGEWLHRRPESVLEWNTRYKIACGAAQGLAFLHHNVHPPFIHRDVNSNNILLDASFDPLIGDVGLAKLYDPTKETESMTDVAGSFGYIAPEYAYTMRVTDKSNVYSFGVILLEILSGHRPVEPSFGEGCDLVSWVRSANDRKETPEQLLDARVSTLSFSVRQEMLRVLDVARLCTSASSSERPKMKMVVEMLHKAKVGGETSPNSFPI